jgi:hypothetical protein
VPAVAPLAATDLAAPLVAQVAGPADGVVDAVVVLATSAVAPGPPTDPDPEPEVARPRSRAACGRAAPQQPSVASKLRLRVRALEEQLRKERTKARRQRSAAKSGETSMKRLGMMLGGRREEARAARDCEAAAARRERALTRARLDPVRGRGRASGT